MITNNLYKLRSSLVRYEKFNNLLPKQTKKARFSDIDMFHLYKGHPLFLELKHEAAKWKKGRRIQPVIHEFFTYTMYQGNFGVILWGTYKDYNMNSDDYYSEFTPTSATIYSPDRKEILEYDKVSGDEFLRKFFKYWYGYCDKNPIEIPKTVKQFDGEF